MVGSPDERARKAAENQAMRAFVASRGMAYNRNTASVVRTLTWLAAAVGAALLWVLQNHLHTETGLYSADSHQVTKALLIAAAVASWPCLALHAVVAVITAETCHVRIERVDVGVGPTLSVRRLGPVHIGAYPWRTRVVADTVGESPGRRAALLLAPLITSGVLGGGLVVASLLTAKQANPTPSLAVLAVGVAELWRTVVDGVPTRVTRIGRPAVNDGMRVWRILAQRDVDLPAIAALIADHDYPNAVAEVERMLAMPRLTDAQQVGLRLRGAQAIVLSGRPDWHPQAWHWLAAVGDTDPRIATQAAYLRARLLFDDGHWAEAVAAYDLLLTIPWLTPAQRAEYLAPRGLARMACGDAMGALVDADQAMTLRNHEPQFCAQVAQPLAAYAIAVLGMSVRYGEADRWSLASFAADPTSPTVGDTRGAVLAVLGQGAEAVDLLARGRAALGGLSPVPPDVGWNHMFTARAYLDMGNLLEARSHADRARLLGAQSPVLDEVQARLDHLT